MVILMKIVLWFSILAMIAIIILISGCITPELKSKNTSNANTNVTETETASTSNIITPTHTLNTLNVSTNQIKNNVHISAGDWCNPGNVETVDVFGDQQQFLVKGLTTYEGNEVCQSEYTYKGGKSVRYVSKDGSFNVMTSASSGGTARSVSRISS
jgi:hypothetical protein